MRRIVHVGYKRRDATANIGLLSLTTIDHLLQAKIPGKLFGARVIGFMISKYYKHFGSSLRLICFCRNYFVSLCLIIN